MVYSFLARESERNIHYQSFDELQVIVKASELVHRIAQKTYKQDNNLS